MQKSPGSSQETCISRSIRVFISINLPSALKTSLQAQIDALSAVIPPHVVRWVQPEGLHLTLKFLGDVPVDELDRIKAATQQAVQGRMPFELQTTEMGCFPNLKRPKIIWIGLNGALEALHALRNSLEDQIAPPGYPTETRPFHPHLTLGRVKAQNSGEISSVGQGIRDAENVGSGKWTCDAVHVMLSTLTASGAEYQSLASYPL